jgi:hypothetical protein
VLLTLCLGVGVATLNTTIVNTSAAACTPRMDQFWTGLDTLRGPALTRHNGARDDAVGFRPGPGHVLDEAWRRMLIGVDEGGRAVRVALPDDAPAA